MGAVETQTLAEFLLARIAEGEAPTWTLAPYECAPGCCAPKGWVGSQCRYCDPVPVYGGTVEAMTSSAEEHAKAIHQRSRVLAECEVKRRIVELSQKWIDGALAALAGDDRGDPQVVRDYTHGYIDGLKWALWRLALPYADHPDYRKEWRP